MTDVPVTVSTGLVTASTDPSAEKDFHTFTEGIKGMKRYAFRI